MAFYAPDDSNFVTEVCGDNSAYRFVKVIGKGGFGRVILAVDHSKGNRYVAIKAVNRAQAPESYICREVNNHRKLSTGHDHVIQLYRLFLTPSYFCFVMEYAEGSTLLNFMEKLYEHEKANPDYFVQQREAWAKWFFQQFALAMDYCHRRGVINRDVKLENTLLTHDFDSYLEARMRNLRQWPMVKITDFGLSKSDKDSMPNSGVGTIQYMAPEVITASRQVSPLGAPYNGQLADIWSLGVLLYVLVYHRFPFQPDPTIEPRGAEGFSAVLHKIVNCELALPTHIYRECQDTRVSTRVSDECRQLLASLLDANPQRRITLDKVLEHPWTTSCDWVVMANAVQWSKEFCKMDVQMDNSEEEVQMILQQVSPAQRSAVLHPAWLDSVVDRALAADSSSSSRLSDVTGMAGGARAART